MAQILCSNVTVGYEDGAVAKNINFQLDAGDYLCILGNNGSGKTTLMRTILGLIKPLSGQISFDTAGAAGQIGYLPQQTPVQKDFPASAEEIVISGFLSKCGKASFYKRHHKEEALDNMRRLGIENLAHKSYKTLSGGQQQRVLLARALCAAKTMLLLDEPTAGLDSDSTAEMYNYIETLNKEGMTIIMISHDMDAALKYASHILDFGRDGISFMTKEEYMKGHRNE